MLSLSRREMDAGAQSVSSFLFSLGLQPLEWHGSS